MLNINTHKSDKTVWTFKELLMQNQKQIGNFARNMSYAITAGNMYHIRKGLYSKDKSYNKAEMSTKIYKPAYVSFETVLQAEGVVFQNYNSIKVATYKTLDIVADRQKINFRKIKDTALLNHEGLIKHGSYYVASKERAILDTLYLNKKYHFDNLRDTDWDKIKKLVKIYENKNLEREVERLYKKYIGNNDI